MNLINNSPTMHVITPSTSVSRLFLLPNAPHIKSTFIKPHDSIYIPKCTLVAI